MSITKNFLSQKLKMIYNGDLKKKINLSLPSRKSLVRLSLLHFRNSSENKLKKELGKFLPVSQREVVSLLKKRAFKSR